MPEASTETDGRNRPIRVSDTSTLESSSLVELQQEEAQRQRDQLVEQDRQAIMEARMQEIIQMQQEIWHEETGKSKIPTIINTPQNSVQDISVTTDGQGRSDLEEIRREQLRLQEQRLRQQQERLELERMRLQLQQKEIEIQRQSQMGMSSYNSQLSGITESSFRFDDTSSTQVSSQQFDFGRRNFAAQKQEASLGTINNSSSNFLATDSKLLAVRQEYDRLTQRQMELNRARPGVFPVVGNNDDPSRMAKINQLKDEYNQLQARQDEIRHRSMAASTSDLQSQSATSRPGAVAASNDPSTGSSDTLRQMREQQKALQARHASRQQGTSVAVGLPVQSNHFNGEPSTRSQMHDPPRSEPGDSQILRQLREQQKALQENRKETEHLQNPSRRPGAVPTSDTESPSLRDLREQQKALQAGGTITRKVLETPPTPGAVCAGNESESFRQLREQQKALQSGDTKNPDPKNPLQSRPGAVSVAGIGNNAEDESTTLRELREQQKTLQGIPINNPLINKSPSVGAITGIPPDSDTFRQMREQQKALQGLPESKSHSTHSISIESFALESVASETEENPIPASGQVEASALRQIREEQRALRLARSSTSLQHTSGDASVTSSEGPETQLPTGTIQQLRDQQNVHTSTSSSASNGVPAQEDKLPISNISPMKIDSFEKASKLGAIAVSNDESDTLRSLREQQKALLEKGRQDSSIASESPEVQAAKLRQMRIHQKALHQTISQQTHSERPAEPPKVITTSSQLSMSDSNARPASSISLDSAQSHHEPAPPVHSRRSSQISRDLQTFQKGSSKDKVNKASSHLQSNVTGQSKRSLFKIGLRKKSQKEKEGQSSVPVQKRSMKNLFSSSSSHNGSTMGSAKKTQTKTQKPSEEVSPAPSGAMPGLEIDRMMDKSEDLWATVEKK